MGRSFDGIADIYDATRPLPPAVGERIADRILDLVAATPDTGFFEPGVGTGRIALPLARRGYAYTGADLAAKMLAEARRKSAGTPCRLALVRAGATALPFAAASFDVALTVHLLHLVPDRQAALAEIRRTLKPGGIFLYCDERGTVEGTRRDFDRRWGEILARHGVGRGPHRAAEEEVLRTLRAGGATLETVTAAEWRAEIAVGELLDRTARRVYSSTWGIPDAVFPGAVGELRAWAAHRYPSGDALLSSELRFTIVVARGWAAS